MGADQPLDDLLQRLRADQQQRWRTGERRLVEGYLHEHPDLAANRELLLDFVYSEFCLRRELGERLDPEEYFARFPQQAGDLRPLFELDRGLQASRPDTEATHDTSRAMPVDPGQRTAHYDAGPDVRSVSTGSGAPAAARFRIL